jgi:hypothetical protein
VTNAIANVGMSVILIPWAKPIILQGRLLALAANIRLGWKDLPVISGIPYVGIW